MMWREFNKSSLDRACDKAEKELQEARKMCNELGAAIKEHERLKRVLYGDFDLI